MAGQLRYQSNWTLHAIKNCPIDYLQVIPHEVLQLIKSILGGVKLFVSLLGGYCHVGLPSEFVVRG